MLPRKNRISRKDFPSYQMKGFRVFSPYFTAVFYKNTTEKELVQRATVVVSKKTAKTAVDRNRLRRRFYDLVRAYFSDINESFTVVIYPKIEAKNAQHEILGKEVGQAFKTAKLTK